MYPYLVLALCLLKLVSRLTDSKKAYVAENAKVLDNDCMVGTWYEVYRFAMWLNLPALMSCVDIKITKATSDDVERLKAAHGDVEPFKFDTTAVLFDRFNGHFTGMLTGSSQTKFFAWDPKSVFLGTQKYKKVNDDCMLFNTCATLT